MFETITKHVRENSVVRFLLSHLIILLAALLICAVGFRRAFVIVRSDVLNSTKFAMTQAVSSVDNGLTELRTLGMQTARSESIYRLENLRHTDDNYYQNIICAINEYYQRMLYYSPNWVNNTFIYLNSMDRVIYSRAVYTPEVFSNHLREWGDDTALWQEVCTDDNRAPFFCKLGGQDIYYGIPSSRLMSGKTGTVFFRIDSDLLKEKFSFLEQYNGYSLFVLDDDNGGVCLYSHDDLNLADSLPEDWLTAQGTWNSGNDLVLHLAGSDSLGLSYLLVLPEQQAMQRLNALLIQMVLLLFAAVVLGTAVSLYFSVRRGRPVNEIARALQAADGAVNTDLNLISGAVTRLVQDNTYLLQEQAADRPALQTAFYHNLLKSNFVSRPEMEYMANRAGIELTEKTYCAAVLRLFPGIDADAIDGQTVEDARVLQQAIGAYVDELCVRPVHNYKRNTLETLYIFEIENQERLLDVLRRVTAWLHEQYHVEAHWGVGTPCDDPDAVLEERRGGFGCPARCRRRHGRAGLQRPAQRPRRVLLPLCGRGAPDPEPARGRWAGRRGRAEPFADRELCPPQPEPQPDAAAEPSHCRDSVRPDGRSRGGKRRFDGAERAGVRLQGRLRKLL